MLSSLTGISQRKGPLRLRHQVAQRGDPAPERAIRIFSNEASGIRLLGAVFLEIDEAWRSQQRYAAMDAAWTWKHGGSEQKEVPDELSAAGAAA